MILSFKGMRLKTETKFTNKMLSTALSLLLTFSLISSAYPQSGSTAIQVFAHRGFRGLSPENTIAGMQRALTYGSILEFDLNITKDKQVVVCHDAILNPKITLGPDNEPLKTIQRLPIYQMDYNTIRTYDVGTKTNADFPQQRSEKAYIPLFGELVDSVETFALRKGLPAVKYFIETKLNVKTDDVNHPQPDEFVELMMRVVKNKGIQQRLIVQSFDPRTLRILRKNYPEVELAFLAKAGTSLDENLKWLGFKPEYYSANAEYIDKELVTQCKKMGLKLIIGNCNDQQQIYRIAKLGVSRVISDYPAKEPSPPL